ncbi:hypothetical protein [Lacinutrix sp. MEBiC02595]
MALMNCKECNQEISDKAEKCPHCGVKLKKSGNGCLIFLIIGILLIIAVYVIGSNGNSSSGVISDDRTYSKSWRSPYGTELKEIGKIIVQNGIRVCGEYEVKEIETNEYVIACTANGKTWDYFVVYTSLGKIYRASEEMETKLNPPR